METSAHVAKLTTVRTLLPVAAIHDWDLYQLDVKNAFLHGDLDENVYMKFPIGYQGPSLPISIHPIPDPSLKVCKLQKSLYGLRQAPRQWFHKLSTSLHNYGFTHSKSDYSLFTKHSAQHHTIILVYVDDLIITRNDSSTIADTKAFLSTQIHMKDLGP